MKKNVYLLILIWVLIWGATLAKQYYETNNLETKYDRLISYLDEKWCDVNVDFLRESYIDSRKWFLWSNSRNLATNLALWFERYIYLEVRDSCPEITYPMLERPLIRKIENKILETLRHI